MATASAGRADKGSSQEAPAAVPARPLQRAPPRGRRSRAGAKKSPRPDSRAPALKRTGRPLATRKSKSSATRCIAPSCSSVHCRPGCSTGRRAPSSIALKYRRGKGEILIVSHGGKGWWDLRPATPRAMRFSPQHPAPGAGDQLRPCPKAPARIRGPQAELPA